MFLAVRARVRSIMARAKVSTADINASLMEAGSMYTSSSSSSTATAAASVSGYKPLGMPKMPKQPCKCFGLTAKMWVLLIVVGAVFLFFVGSAVVADSSAARINVAAKEVADGLHTVETKLETYNEIFYDVGCTPSSFIHFNQTLCDRLL